MSDGWLYECTPGHAERCRVARTPSDTCTCDCNGYNHGESNRDINPDGVLPLTDREILSAALVGEFRPEGSVRTSPIICQRVGNMAVVNIPQILVVHSPTGFEWGYAGSGPAELALNILNIFLFEPDAWLLHQEFKMEFILTMDEAGGTITPDQVRQWIIETWKSKQEQP